MQKKTEVIKPDANGDMIGEIKYPIMFEKIAIPVGILFTAFSGMAAATSPEKAINVFGGAILWAVTIAAIVVISWLCLRSIPAARKWLKAHPILGCGIYLAIIFFFAGLIISFGG